MNLPLWFSNLLFWSAQVALLVLAAAFLPRLFQIRQPRVLISYWRLILLLTIALPFVQSWHRPANSVTVLVFSDNGSIRVPAAPTPAASLWHFPNLQLLVEIAGIVLLAGIVLRFGFLALGVIRLRRLRQTSTPIALAHPSAETLNQILARVGVNADFRLSSKIYSPVTFGMKNPVVLLPEIFSSMDSPSQSAIACHELLHVRRRDWAHHLSEEILRAILWFHPAILWVISRVRLAREQIVDLEVIQLTNARKHYLEALLAFTTARTRFAPIPAPPFLAERQLVERISLMLKEAHMARRKVVASLGVISCCLVLVVGLSAWRFPLKRAPLQSPGGDASTPAESVTIDRSEIWIDTVKKGPMIRQVRGLGTLVRTEGSGNLIARITLPEIMTQDLHLNQRAQVDTRKGVVNGHVSRIDSLPSNGSRFVDISIDGSLPEGAGVDLAVDGTIDIARLENVVYVGRPVRGAANTSVPLFKIIKDGKEAERVNVKLGRSSAQTIEVLGGLQEGDQVILSDMSQWDNVNRIHLK